MRKVILLIAVFLISGCDNPTSSDDPMLYRVKYVVTGTSSNVIVSLQNENKGNSTFTLKTLPWSYKFLKPVSAGTYVAVHAVNNTLDNTTIQVEIYANDKLFKSSSAVGPYSSATAEGTL